MSFTKEPIGPWARVPSTPGGNDPGRTPGMSAGDASFLVTEIARALEPAVGEVEVEGLRRLTGGASRETWAFDATDTKGVRHELILRRDFPGGAAQNPDILAGRDDAMDRAGEFDLLKALHGRGLPVPRPLALPASSELEGSFIMERVPGESRPHVLVRDYAQVTGEGSLAWQLGRILASIHGLGETDLPPIPQRQSNEKLEIVRVLLDRGPARPGLELAWSWLAENRPAEGDLVLVHGDYRTANYIVGPDGIEAIIDWEFSHLGDRHEDLAFVCMRAWRFGADGREASGVGSREELHRGYVEAGGLPPDEALLHYCDILAHLFAAAVFMMRAVQFEEGSERSLEGAAIGRRLAEIEYDLLDLLD